jgi:ABC-type bacteriocin/lantibiotic exporter with double-glycine peptidase domain
MFLIDRALVQRDRQSLLQTILFLGAAGLTISAAGLLRDPAILLFDEATSALDPSTETALNETIRRAARGRAILSVTHRLASVAESDAIFVFDRGLLVERGTHNELMDRKVVSQFESVKRFGREYSSGQTVAKGSRTSPDPEFAIGSGHLFAGRHQTFRLARLWSG